MKLPFVMEFKNAFLKPPFDSCPEVMMYREADAPAIAARLVLEIKRPCWLMESDPDKNVKMPVISCAAENEAPAALFNLRLPNFPEPFPPRICAEGPASVILPDPLLVCVDEFKTVPNAVTVFPPSENIPLVRVSVLFTRTSVLVCRLILPPEKELLMTRFAKFVRLPGSPEIF